MVSLHSRKNVQGRLISCTGRFCPTMKWQLGDRVADTLRHTDAEGWSLLYSLPVLELSGELSASGTERACCSFDTSCRRSLTLCCRLGDITFSVWMTSLKVRLGFSRKHCLLVLQALSKALCQWLKACTDCLQILLPRLPHSVLSGPGRTSHSSWLTDMQEVRSFSVSEAEQARRTEQSGRPVLQLG